VWFFNHDPRKSRWATAEKTKTKKQEICMGSGGIRVVCGGCGAKAPSLAVCPGSPEAPGPKAFQQ